MGLYFRSELRAVRFAQISPGEPDEDRLQAGFGDGEVAQAVRVAGANDLRQQAVGVVGEDEDSAGRGLHATHALHLL